MPIKNSIIESQLTSFSNEQQISSETESERFEKFSIYSCERGYLKSGIDPFNAHLEGEEFGIDGVAILVNGELVDNLDQFDSGFPISNVEFHFFQTKSSNSFDTGETLKFFSAIVNFFIENYDAPTEQMLNLFKIKNYIYENSGDMNENPQIKLFYITTGTYQSPVDIEREISTIKERLSETNLFSEISVEMIGASLLQDRYRNTNKAVTAEIEFSNNVVLPTIESIEDAYIGYLDAQEIIKLTSTDGKKINPTVFYDNIRDYDPESDINKSISEALDKGEGSLFVFRNNGITVVAKDLKRTGNRFPITDYQIVNGCQTSHILFNNSEKITNTSVPFRLIKCTDDKDISSIIVGTNLQNPVKKEQFWSLTPFMKNFEEYCSSLEEPKRIYFERRENQYRGSDIEKVRIITPVNLLKSVTSVLFFEGNRSGRSYASIRKEYSPKLFMDAHEVSIYHMSAYCFYRLEYLWRNNKIDSKYKIYRFIILTSIGRILTNSKKLLEMSNKEGKQIALRVTNYISDDDRLKILVDKVNKRIEKIVEENIDSANNARDLIRNEEINKKITDSISKISSPDISKY